MPFPYDVLSWLIRGRYKVTPLALADGETGELQVDSIGALLVRIVGGARISSYHRTLVPAASGVVGAGARKLVAAWGFNKGSSDRYVGFYNRTTVPNAGTEQPTEQFLVPAGGSFYFEPPEPIDFAAGIVWAASSAPGVWTNPTTSDIAITVAHQA